jgi:GR25 family glycosyltransferase involved in LPS biosynthesis
MNIPFDKAYCVSYCRNIEKQNNMRKLMKYLGIQFEFIYGADYNNLNILKHKDFHFLTMDQKQEDSFKEENFKGYTHFIGASYDHYTAVLHAYESGANSVLILEDDCTYINDLSYINWALNNYPKDADYVMFGYADSNHFHKDEVDIKDIKEKFILLRNNIGVSIAGSQLYGLCNRKIMKEYIDLQANKFQSVDNVPFRLADKGKKIYLLVKPIGIDLISIEIDKTDKYKKYSLFNNIK